MKKNYTMPQVGVITLQAGERLMWELENSSRKDDPAQDDAPGRRGTFRSLRLQW